MNDTWRLKSGDIILGKLVRQETDQPWIFCRFEPELAFREYEALFLEELRLLDMDEWKQWEQTYQRIVDLGLVLEPIDGKTTVTEFLLHIDGNEAWFRY